MNSTTASYAIRFVLSSKEYEILISRLRTSTKSQLWKSLIPVETVKQTELHESQASALLHEHARILVRFYAAISLLNIALYKRKGQPLPAAAIATVVTTLPAIYRVVNFSGQYFLGSGIIEKQLSVSTNSETLNKAKELSQQLLLDKKFSAAIVPVLSGLVSGCAYQLIPGGPARSYMSLYVLSKTLETIYNYLDDINLLEFKPRVFGSWCLFPFAFGQLFYSFVFHPDCCTDAFKRIMFGLSSPYFPSRPEGYPENKPWPTPEQTVKGIAWVSQHSYPKFVPPILSPSFSPAGVKSSSELFKDPELSALGNVANVAHPGIKKLTSALMHPNDVSEFHAYTNMIGQNFSRISKYLFVLYAAVGLTHQLSKRRRPMPTEDKLSESITEEDFNNKSKLSPMLNTLSTLGTAVLNTIRTTSFITLSTASAWAGIGLFQELANNKFIPESRYKLIGFFSGLWAFLDQVNGRTRYMYAVRMAVLSHWNILKKRGQVKPYKNGDVMLFGVCFALLMGIFEVSPASVSGPLLRKSLNWIKTSSFIDPAEKHSSRD